MVRKPCHHAHALGQIVISDAVPEIIGVFDRNNRSINV